MAALLGKLGNLKGVMGQATGVMGQATSAMTKAKGIMGQATGAIEQTTGAIGQAKGVLGQATGGPGKASDMLGQVLGDKNPLAALGKDSPLGAITGLMGGPDGQEAAPAAPEGPKITDEEKKAQVLKAYCEIIYAKKAEIQQKFTEALERYIKANLDVNNDELKKFIEHTTFQQMTAYFDKINTSYVKHAFVIQIFQKRKDLLLQILEKSVQNANVLSVGNTSGIVEKSSEVFNAFKGALKEMNAQNNVIRGGNPDVSDDPAKRISEIASWFPDTNTVDGNTVDIDMKYVIQQIFVKTMEEDDTLATTINTHMTKHIFPMIIEVMKKMIASQTMDVDVAILYASIEHPDVESTVLRAIRNSLVNTKETIAAGLAGTIYENILKMSKEKYDEDIENISGKKNPVIGGRKSKRTTRRKKRVRHTRKRM